MNSNCHKYADTTAFPNGHVNSLNLLMHISNAGFKKVSGLGIDSDKIKVAKIKALRGRSIPWEGRYDLEWRNTFDVLGISYNVNGMGKTII